MFAPNPADTPRKMPMSSLRLLAPLLGLALSVPAGAQNIDLPIRKEGLWQMSTIVSGAPATTSTLCMDKSFSKEMLQMGGSIGCRSRGRARRLRYPDRCR